MAPPTYVTAALTYHNERRSQHQVPPLKLSPKLNTIALQCAKYYVEEVGTIDHSCTIKDDETGENLWEMTTEGIDLTKYDSSALALEACEAWYKEVELYDFNNPGFDLETGHFTAMIWRDVKSLGVGVYKKENIAVVVCLYTPHPNVEGEFEENVLPAA